MSNIIDKLDTIDEKATIKKARTFLKRYKDIKALADRPTKQNLTILYSNMPKHKSMYAGNAQIEKGIELKEDSIRTLKRIELAYNNLDALSQRRIHQRFMTDSTKTLLDYAMDEYISERMLIRQLNQALLNFALNYPTIELLCIK